ncbi:MAG: hypothetical protein J6C62_06005 [Clostridia bacterium]|nr:hypothetical protein [Clostridia bacterium]
MDYNENTQNERNDEQLETAIETTAPVPVKKKSGKYKALWIITPILYSLVTLFLVYTLYDTVVGANPDTLGLSLALWLTLFLIIFGTFGYIAAMIPAIIGLILTIVRRPSGLRVGQLIYFIVFTILPILSWIAFTVIVPLLQ